MIKLFMKSLKFIFLFTILIITACNRDTKKNSKKTVQKEIKRETTESRFPFLKETSKIASEYCFTKKLNTEYYFLIDLKRHSGLKRFYIWDFKKDTIINSFLVSHGCADNPWGSDLSKENAKTSNIDGSHASSVGKYIIGKRGYSNWGIHVNYLLHGKDKTNFNALQRQIVLHSWEEVADEETYPIGTPEGWGCPAVSNSTMHTLDEILIKSNKNVLLWIVK
ncbi:murein L,D-transpeptidase catalytic domain-containing protein [Flavobacterium adhaerens]|uniref:murein L,D-transpeptidase catalytic domain-containing protein n=1 Tax=Flavobacterium adhaerens TaxID=3149043 RepID=UPI0032B5C143